MTIKEVFDTMEMGNSPQIEHIDQELVNNSKNLRGYLVIWTGQLISLLGSGIVQFAIIWWLTIETESTFMLALATFVGLVPMVIIGPFAGVLADRWSRKKIMLSSDFFQALATIGLIILFWLNIVEVWHVLLLIAIRGTFQAFQMPASVSVVPQMVPKDQISRLNGLGQIFGNFIFILSPILGALILELYTINLVLWIDVITFFVAVFSLLPITIPPVIKKATSEVEQRTMSFKAQFFESIGYLKANGWMPLIIGFTIGNILINPLFSLIPLFIKEIHLGGAFELAVVIGMFQIGSLIGSLLIVFKNYTPKISTIVFAVLTSFIGLFIISLSPVGLFSVISGGTLIVGFSVAIIDVGIVSILQIHIPPELQGRIFSVTFTLIKSILPIALLFVGGIAEIIGLPLVYLICPVLGFLLVGYLAFVADISSLDQRLSASKTPQPV